MCSVYIVLLGCLRRLRFCECLYTIHFSSWSGGMGRLWFLRIIWRFRKPDYCGSSFCSCPSYLSLKCLLRTSSTSQLSTLAIRWLSGSLLLYTVLLTLCVSVIWSLMVLNRSSYLPNLTFVWYGTLRFMMVLIPSSRAWNAVSFFSVLVILVMARKLFSVFSRTGHSLSSG